MEDANKTNGWAWDSVPRVDFDGRPIPVRKRGTIEGDVPSPWWFSIHDMEDVRIQVARSAMGLRYIIEAEKAGIINLDHGAYSKIEDALHRLIEAYEFM